MTDKEIIQGRIDELENNIRKGRSTGKTYRAINAVIEELFNKPIGSQIHLIDDEYTIGFNAFQSTVGSFEVYC